MNEKNYNKLVSELSKQLGIDSKKITEAAADGNYQKIIDSTGNSNAKQAGEILSNPEKTKKILSSPEAQALLRLLEE